jgi:hypothetical protein
MGLDLFYNSNSSSWLFCFGHGSTRTTFLPLRLSEGLLTDANHFPSFGHVRTFGHFSFRHRTSMQTHFSSANDITSFPSDDGVSMTKSGKELTLLNLGSAWESEEFSEVFSLGGRVQPGMSLGMSGKRPEERKKKGNHRSQEGDGLSPQPRTGDSLPGMIGPKC